MRRRFPFKTLLFIILLAGFFYVWKRPPFEYGATTPYMEAYTPVPQAQAQDAERGGAEEKPPAFALEFNVPLSVGEINDTRALELVNLEYAINDEPMAGLIVSAWPDVPVSSKEVTIHSAALEAVREMFAAAREANDGTYYVASGYRNRDRQALVYNDAADKSFVQPPGHSEHQTGLAADIFIIGIGQNDMALSREGRWLAENSWKYGLILRYPEGKRAVTGIGYEPWHFRYVGQPHAQYCRENNLCFEEYIQFLKDGGGYSAELDGKTYHVLYQIPSDGIIYVPEGSDYSVSGDNTGGYIITAWE